jgi:hypothetical protein
MGEMTKAPRTEQYQATQDGFMEKYYYKGNLKTFNEGEMVPSWFSPVAEILAEHQANEKPETMKPPKADRPTMEDAGIKKPTPQTDKPAPSNEGRMSLEDAGVVKAKPTVDQPTTGTDAPTTEVEVEPAPEPEEKKPKKKVKRKVKKKTAKKKAKK